ncbi:MAG: type II 3-dehydroquinate dehydratase [Tissierellia bacterium]|nr:type II 3-dehydroquinate dehydratase [Tissierellia bacterium]
MKILIINGPNINMVGIREPEIYGGDSYEEFVTDILSYGAEKNVEIEAVQSNHEGAVIDSIQEAYGNFDGIIINAGAYTHTSIAILDALKAVGIRTVEVHLSDISKREDYRKKSFISEYAEKVIVGKGFKGYYEAVDYLRDEV